MPISKFGTPRRTLDLLFRGRVFPVGGVILLAGTWGPACGKFPSRPPDPWTGGRWCRRVGSDMLVGPPFPPPLAGAHDRHQNAQHMLQMQAAARTPAVEPQLVRQVRRPAGGESAWPVRCASWRRRAEVDACGQTASIAPVRVPARPRAPPPPAAKPALAPAAPRSRFGGRGWGCCRVLWREREGGGGTPAEEHASEPR